MSPPVAPAIPSIPAGWAPLPADMTAWITTPFTFLASPAAFRGQLQGSESLSGFTLAKLDTVIEDNWGGWSATATASQPAYSWLCPAGCDGWFDISLTAFSSNPATTTDQLQAVIYIDGSLYQQASAGWGVNGHDSGSTAAVQVPLIGGQDYVQMYIYSTASTTTPATAGQYPAMEISWWNA